MPRGGKRPGAGKPKGYKHPKGPKMLEKEAARTYLRQRVTADLGPLLDAQIANAKGLSYLVIRDKSTGKFIRVPEGMARVHKGEELIEVWEKDPSVPAFTDLLNRALDKPREQVDVDLTLQGSSALLEALDQAKQRNRGKP